MRSVYGIGWRGDRRDRARPSYVGRGDEIGDVGREPGIRELALARTDPCEIETQDSNAAGGKRMRDAASREIVLAAGKAMGKQRISGGLLRRTIEQSGESQPIRVGEFEALNRHVSSPTRRNRAPDVRHYGRGRMPTFRPADRRGGFQC